ncbi:MAG: CAP domain-containing protein [Desulfosoma sp.]
MLFHRRRVLFAIALCLAVSAEGPSQGFADSPPESFLIAAAPSGPSTPVPEIRPPMLPPDETAAHLASLVNAVRARYGLAPLSVSGQLGTAALTHCADMARNGFVSHTGSGGTSPWHRMVRQGYPVRRYGENVAVGLADPVHVLTAWLQSESHRKVLLSAHFTEMGIGYVFDPRSPQKHYWTLDVAQR